MPGPISPLDVFNAGNVFAGVQISALAPLTLTGDTSGKVNTPIDFTASFMADKAGSFLSIYIDNSTNDATILVQSERTGQWVKCPPFCVGWFPFITGVGGPPQCKAYAVTTRATVVNVPVNIAFSNVALVQGPVSFRDAYDATLQEVTINASGSGDLTLVAGVALQTVRVHRLFWTLDAVSTVTVKRAATALTGALSAQTAMFDYSDLPWFTTNAGEGFILNLSAAAQISGRLYFRQSA